MQVRGLKWLLEAASIFGNKRAIIGTHSDALSGEKVHLVLIQMPLTMRWGNIKGHFTLTLRMSDRCLGRLLRSIIRTTLSVPFIYFISWLNIMSSSRPDPHKLSVLPYKKGAHDNICISAAMQFFFFFSPSHLSPGSGFPDHKQLSFNNFLRQVIKAPSLPMIGDY